MRSHVADSVSIRVRNKETSEALFRRVIDSSVLYMCRPVSAFFRAHLSEKVVFFWFVRLSFSFCCLLRSLWRDLIGSRCSFYSGQWEFGLRTRPEWGEGNGALWLAGRGERSANGAVGFFLHFVTLWLSCAAKAKKSEKKRNNTRPEIERHNTRSQTKLPLSYFTAQK